jgi:DNA-binding PucR family transcriptional regulator
MSGTSAGLLSCGNAERAARAVDMVGELARTRVGVSPIFTSLAEAPDNLRYARVAMASLPAQAIDVRQFAATPLAVLAAGNPDASRQVARSVLGGILTLPADDRDTYLETLRAWLDAVGSARDAGRAIFVHANTIRHRLRRIEEHTGRDLANPQDVAEISVALQAIALFPDLAP